MNTYVHIRVDILQYVQMLGWTSSSDSQQQYHTKNKVITEINAPLQSLKVFCIYHHSHLKHQVRNLVLIKIEKKVKTHARNIRIHLF